MKENNKKTRLLSEDTLQSSSSYLPDNKKDTLQRLKKPLIFTLMGIVCASCMYLIFKPSVNKKQLENIGLNDSVPQASASILQADKQKAYEQEMLEQKEQQKHNALTTLSDYWTQDSTEPEQAVPDEVEKTKNPALSTYRTAQNTLGSFYQEENGETKQLRKQLEELREELAQKDVPPTTTVDDQLELMEKSYQLAAKYLPSGSNPAETTVKKTALATEESKKQNFSAFIPAKKNSISALYRPSSDNAFTPGWNTNRGFNSPEAESEEQQPKNSVRACVHQTQTLIGEADVALRLLEAARISGRIISEGSIIWANARIQAGRITLKVTSIEIQGTIIPVDITIYDLQGQQGLPVPYSAERSALSEMAGNMSQQSGTSIMMTQSAGQQVAADLSRGVVQGIGSYFSKKVRTPKVTLKAGHEVLLVSKK